MMTTVTVDTSADVIANDGLTSLREAIVTTNSGFRNRIDFDASLSGSTIRLNSQLFVTDTLTIDASALSQNIVINAQHNSRVFDFSGTGDDFTLRSVTVQNGEIADVGGGIRFSSSGELTLYDSKVIGNRTTGNNNPGGGIYTQSGNITLIDSTVSENSTEGNDSNGGGIRTHSGNVTLTRTTVSDNNTLGDDSNGGGIRTHLGDVTLTRSTVAANYTTGHDSDGAGVQTFGGTVTATNTTISGNEVVGTDSQGGGIHTVAGEVIVNHSTITDNSTGETQITGAGISMDPGNFSLSETLTIHDSIVAGNYVRAGVISDFLAPAGPISALTVTHSLIGDNLATTLTEAQTPDADGNLIGSTTNPIDPLLGPLTDNGGATETHSLLRGSPALDAGDPLMLNLSVNDQRGAGFPRVVAGRVDMGAFEVDQVVVNDNSRDVDDGLPDNGTTTLREAVSIANSSDTPTLIRFDPSLSGQTIGLTGVLQVTENLTVDATALESNVIVDGQGFSHIFQVDWAGFGDPVRDLAIAGLTLTGGQSSGSGGAIHFAGGGTLTIVDSTISGNLAAVDGGGIYNSGGVLDISRTTVSNNTSYNNGGGIAARITELAIVDITISGNTADRSGGGLFGYGASGDVTSSTISGNYAGTDGGGLYCNHIMEVHHSTITENTADARGGGFHRETIPGRLSGSIVSGNYADNVPDNLSGRFISGSHNLLGDGGLVYTPHNIIGVNDPLLGPLADNGGPTLTHALLPGSLAIDAGFPGAVPGLDVPEFDQRGEAFTRVFGTTMDIGSFELQATTIDPDFNDDGNIDGVDMNLLQANIASGPADPAMFDLTGDGQVTIADRDEWLVQAGAANLPSGNPYLLGDATLDGVVDGQDFVLWNNHKFTSSSDWTGGDFNSDGIVDGQDFVLWNNHKFMSADATASGQTNPSSFTDLTQEDEDSRSYERHVDDLFAAFA